MYGSNFSCDLVFPYNELESLHYYMCDVLEAPPPDEYVNEVYLLVVGVCEYSYFGYKLHPDFLPNPTRMY